MINESLNSPWELFDITNKQPFRTVAEMSKAMMGYTEFTVYTNNEITDLVIVAFRDGAWEIHHAKTEDFTTAQKLNDANPPMRFVSTLLALSKEKLAKGASVRFIATDEMMPGYTKLIKMLVKKFGNNQVSIGPITPYEHQGKLCKAIVVSPIKSDTDNIRDNLNTLDNIAAQ